VDVIKHCQTINVTFLVIEIKKIGESYIVMMRGMNGASAAAKVL